ncbi:MAG: hypothetical protein JRH20_00880 [Deltaproteobacteria bacterium]|nr:hypothetical protein [Deltaproteobacteria bacterium]
MLRSLLILTLAMPLFATARPALARSTISVLAFGGPNAKRARARVVAGLRKRYNVLGANSMPEACADLGIAMTKGRNLARCAKHIGAVAVVGGKAAKRQLTLVVFSGKSGQVLLSTRTRWSRRPNRKMVRRALAALRRGLAKAPRRVGRRRPPAPAPRPQPTSPQPLPEDEPGLSFNPDEITGDGSTPSDGGNLPPEDGPENPLGSSKAKPPTDEPAAAQPKTEKTHAKATSPRALALLGVGTWLRSFSINAPATPDSDATYSSGATFALRLEGMVRPASFFTDNIAADFFSRLRFQTVLGLGSVIEAGSDTLSTSIMELLFDVGYRLEVFRTFGESCSAESETCPQSPTVDLSFGYGITSFEIDWGAQTQSLPNVDYGFLLIGLGGNYPFPFYELMGAHMRFDYRIVTGSGQISTDQRPGYGPASTGGLALTLGVNGRLGNILARLEYSYTRYFFSFNDPLTRRDNGLPAAGGAVDNFHMIQLSGGYAL